MPENLLVRKRKVHQNRLIVTKLYSFLVWLPESHKKSREAAHALAWYHPNLVRALLPRGVLGLQFGDEFPCHPKTGQEWRVHYIHGLVTKHWRKLNSKSL